MFSQTSFYLANDGTLYMFRSSTVVVYDVDKESKTPPTDCEAKNDKMVSKV